MRSACSSARLSHEVGCLAREMRRAIEGPPQMEGAIVAADGRHLRQPFEGMSQTVVDNCDMGV